MTVLVNNLKYLTTTVAAFSDSVEFKLFAPLLTTEIAPNVILLNSEAFSKLTITIKNVDKDMGLNLRPYEAIQNFKFSQSYPVSPTKIRNATVPNVTYSSSCGSPNITAVSQGGSISVTGTGATVPAYAAGVYGTCTITVDMTAVLQGQHATLFSSAVSSDNAISTNFGTIPFWVYYSPPDISKVFATNPVSSGSNSLMTIKLTNQTWNPKLTGVSFTDSYPTGSLGGQMVNSGSVVSNSCGGTVTTTSTSLALSGGEIPAYTGTGTGYCEVKINVQSTSAGVFPNYTGDLSTAETGSQTGASADLTVVGSPPSATSAFSLSPSPTLGVSRLTITLSNPNTSPITLDPDLAFFTAYTSPGLENAPGGSSGNSCGGTILGGAGDNYVGLAGGTISGTGSRSCAVWIDVVGDMSGVFHSSDDGGGNATTFDIWSNVVSGVGTGADLTVYGPDFQIVKRVTSLSSPCLAGTCSVTYTLSLSIVSGTGNGSAFTVSDALPAQLTYVSSSANGNGSIAYDSGSNTVTWTYPEGTGNITAGAAAKTATITATVNTATQISNTARIASYAPVTDPNLANNSDTTTFQASALSLMDLRAETGPNGTVVVWETAEEAGTVGFYLFRKIEKENRYLPVGLDLIPGLIGSSSGGTYRLADPDAPGGVPLTYVLVEQQADGERIAYGPIVVESAPEGLIAAGVVVGPGVTVVGQVGTDSSGILAGFFDEDGNLVTVAERPKGGVHQAPYAVAGELTRIPRGISEARAARVAAVDTKGSVEENVSFVLAPFQPIALGSTAVTAKIRVANSGLRFISSAQLVSLLGNPPLDVGKQIKKGKLNLSYMNKGVAWLAADNGIYVYGEASDSPFTNDRVYLASWADGETMKGEVRSVSANVVVDPLAAFQASQHLEKDLIVNLGNPDAASDYWHWAYVLASGGTPAAKSFDVLTEGARGTGTATMKLRLYGGTDIPTANPDHKVDVRVNGIFVGSGQWDGFNWYDLDVSFNASILKGGSTNSVELTALLPKGVPVNLVYLDSIEMTYPRTYQAVANSLLYSASEGDVNGGGLTISGFTTSDIVVLNISIPSTPVIVSGARVSGSAGAFRVAFLPAAIGAQYLVTTLSAARSPESIQLATGTSLKDHSNGADYIVITAPGLEAPAANLASLRAAQGWTPKVVLVGEIMDAFGAGNFSPAAIRDFLSYATANWTKKPKAVVLAGDGSYDYRNNLGYGGNLVPTMMVSTPFGLAASDNGLVDFDGNGVPDIAIGRLAVLNAAELQTVVDKLAAYDAAAHGTWDAKVVLSADTVVTAGVSNFSNDSESLAGLMPAADPMDKVYLDSLSVGNARTRLQGDLTAGSGFLNFYGHSTPTKLAPTGLLLSQDVPLIQVGSRTPIVTAGTCFTNRFFDPTGDALGETLSIQGGGYGAIAVFSSSGYSLTSQATTLIQNFYRSIWQKTAATVGEAALISLRDFRNGGGALFMAQTYTLLGDPATPLRYGR